MVVDCIVPVKKIVCAICLLALAVFAEDRNIPLPSQSAYVGKGISVGIGAGIFNPTKDCDCLGVWQGQLEYFYSETISGGIDVRFFGGDLDPDVMVMNQRYRMIAKFHFPFKNLDFYVSPVFGLESTNIETFREEWDNREENWWRPGSDRDNDESEWDCEKMFSLEGFSMGAEIGAGWSFSRFFGITGSSSYEYNFARAQLLNLTPGVAFNLREVWPWAKQTLLSVWISVEVGFQRYFNRGVDEWASSGFLGLQIGI